MKQASHSLLTLCPISIMAMHNAPILIRDDMGADNRYLTPFHVHQENLRNYDSALLGWPCLPRSSVRSRLGEGRIRSLPIWFFVLCISLFTQIHNTRPLYGADSTEICLKGEAIVHSGTVLLKDIADLKGRDATRLEELSKVVLGTAPPFGLISTLSRHQVEKIVEADVGSIAGISFTGAVLAKIELQGRQVKFGEIAPLLKTYLQAATLFEESEIKIESIKNLENIEIPRGATMLHISPGTAIIGNRSILAPIKVAQDGKRLSSFWVTADVAVHARIVISAGEIPFGKVITAEDIEETTIPIADIRKRYVRNPDNVLGKASRRTFASGDPLTCDAFENPYLVKSGETIKLRSEGRGIVLTCLVRAEQNGYLGEVIRVRNLDFAASLQAKITGPGEAIIQEQGYKSR